MKKAISELKDVDTLRYAPVFYNEEVGDEIANMFASKELVPTFFFVDPWGYKGLSLKLVSSIIKDWGCDCVFFFNYNRVNMGVNNEAIQQHMISLFGETGLKQLQKDCAGVSPAEREMIVVQALCDSLKQNGSKFVLPFRFKNEQGNRTSHHLIFLSKSFRGYDIMKDIMYSESSQKIGNVASFEYNPRDVNFRQGSVFDLLSRPLDELSDMLQNTYAGKCIDFRTLYEEHSVDTPYVRKNYKDALKALYESGKINAVNAKTGKPPKKGTFSDDMRITFKARK